MNEERTERLTVDIAEQLVLPGDDPTGDIEQVASAHSFAIEDDATAEWALKKISAAVEEYDRLEQIYNDERARLDALLDKAAARLDSKTAYLKGLLQRYFETVPHEVSKAGTETYRLLSGKLVQKRGGYKATVSDDALVDWCERTGRGEYIKTTKKPAWGELKKALDFTEAGAVVKDTGELVDGVDLEYVDGSFEIKS